uniref:Uncharacterized protein n=1 Tax=Panagrolaimus sp. JU765 TaxID=591449 RepID=A0AC34RL28_9BILA
MNVWSKSFIVILTLFLNCQCAPRGPDLSQVDKPIGKLNYEIAEPLTAATNQNQQTQSTGQSVGIKNVNTKTKFKKWFKMNIREKEKI